MGKACCGVFTARDWVLVAALRGRGEVELMMWWTDSMGA